MGFDNSKFLTVQDKNLDNDQYVNQDDEYKKILGEYEEMKMILGTRFKQ